MIPFRLTAIVLCAFLVSCLNPVGRLSAQDGKNGKPAGSAEITFPEIEGWRKIKRRSLPEGMGAFAVGYNSPAGAFVTVYVYTRGLKEIPADISSPIVKRELERSAEGIQAVVKIGVYKSAKLE